MTTDQELLAMLRRMREQAAKEEPECGLCGEPADLEMGEFHNPEFSAVWSIIAHAQCGLDAGLELA